MPLHAVVAWKGAGMVPAEGYKGYSISTWHPGATMAWCAYQGSNIWFEGHSREALMTQIDEALADC